METRDVLGVLARFAQAGLDVWVDGGWGVDALVGRQTRSHDDLDLVIRRGDVASAVALLIADGFVRDRDLLPTAVAYRCTDGRAVDLHPVDPSEDGGGDQMLSDGTRWHYSAPVDGTLDGRAIPCCSVATQVAAHLGYEPDADDRADMAVLAEHFGLALPPPYG